MLCLFYLYLPFCMEELSSTVQSTENYEQIVADHKQLNPETSDKQIAMK